MSEFDVWNKRKKYIHAKHERVFYHEREIRWCKLGKNIGFEEGGGGKDFDRPVLILKAFSRETCLVVPLTSSKNKHKFRFIIDDKSTAILSQIKVIDTKRLFHFVKRVDVETFNKIKEAIHNMIG